MNAPRVVIADDAVLVRDALASLLRTAGCAVVAEVGDGATLLTAVASTAPDVAVVDVRMPPTHRTEGLDAAAVLRRRHPGTGVLVLSQHLESHHLHTLLGEDARGVGYLLKERVAGAGEFIDAVRTVATGGCAVDPEVVDLLVRTRRGSVLAGLSSRERTVLALMASGCSNAGIARRLHLTSRTVETHVRNIMLRLDLPAEAEYHRRVLAVLTWLHDPPSWNHPARFDAPQFT